MALRGLYGIRGTQILWSEKGRAELCGVVVVSKASGFNTPLEGSGEYSGYVTQRLSSLEEWKGRAKEQLRRNVIEA